jgi:hypothetical protein
MTRIGCAKQTGGQHREHSSPCEELDRTARCKRMGTQNEKEEVEAAAAELGGRGRMGAAEEDD